MKREPFVVQFFDLIYQIFFTGCFTMKLELRNTLIPDPDNAGVGKERS
jgi:hypothetical protein